jgi:hypothetical protein
MRKPRPNERLGIQGLPPAAVSRCEGPSEPEDPQPESDLDPLLNHIEEAIREGIACGFFECRIECAIGIGHKRQLKVTTARSRLFYISEEDARG